MLILGLLLLFPLLQQSFHHNFSSLKEQQSFVCSPNVNSIALLICPTSLCQKHAVMTLGLKFPVCLGQQIYQKC